MAQTPVCQQCKAQPAAWAVQDIAGELSVSMLGNHYRGFAVVKMCDSCKDAAVKAQKCPAPDWIKTDAKEEARKFLHAQVANKQSHGAGWDERTLAWLMVQFWERGRKEAQEE